MQTWERGQIFFKKILFFFFLPILENAASEVPQIRDAEVISESKQFVSEL